MSKYYRFSGKTGDEYELFAIACPHYWLLEERISREAVKATAKRRKIRILDIGFKAPAIA